MSLRSHVCEIIHGTPGLTAPQIARRIYRTIADPGPINRVCRALIEEGYVIRQGRGGAHEPFTYRWVGKTAPSHSARGSRASSLNLSISNCTALNSRRQSAATVAFNSEAD